MELALVLANRPQSILTDHFAMFASALDHYKHLLEKKKSMAETGSGVLSHRRTGMNDTR